MLRFPVALLKFGPMVVPKMDTPVLIPALATGRRKSVTMGRFRERILFISFVYRATKESYTVLQ